MCIVCVCVVCVFGVWVGMVRVYVWCVSMCGVCVCVVCVWCGACVFGVCYVCVLCVQGSAPPGLAAPLSATWPTRAVRQAWSPTLTWVWHLGHAEDGSRSAALQVPIHNPLHVGN